VFIKTCSLSEVPTKDIKSYALNLPLQVLNFRLLNLPNIAHKRLRDIIPYEIEGHILTKREDLVFDFLIEPKDGGGLRTVVVYMDRGVLQEVIGPLKKLGINPVVITCSTLRGALSEGIEGLAERLVRLEGQSPNVSCEDDPILEAQELLTPVIRLSDRETAVEGLKEGLIRPIFRTALLIVILLCILTGWLIFNISTTARESASLKRDLRARYTTLFPDERKVSDENYQLKSKIKTLQDKAQTLIGVNAFDVLKGLSMSKVEGIIISELSVDKDTIKLKGESQSIEAIEAYKKGLLWVSNPMVSDVLQAEKGLYSFRLSGRLKRDK
jgi:type II secretory pathway component PulL